MEILITICARGGSKGIPGKNIKDLNGKPLILYTLETAQQFKHLYNGTDIVLSTDDHTIKDVVVGANFAIDTSYTRPSQLATDMAGKIPVIEDILLYSEQKSQKRYDIILDLDITSPLRTTKDLETALEILLADPDAYNLFSVSRANRNPYFNMVEENGVGYVELCKKGEFLNRQTAPKVYELNASFYFYRRTFFDKNFRTVFTNKSRAYEVPHICFDLDHGLDFEFLSYMLANDKLGFTLG